ncbi:MAG: DUF1549 domain-containing protein [Akkermansiaceae bacterium]
MKILLSLALVSAVTAKPLSLDIVQNTARQIDETLLLEQKELNLSANPIANDSTFLRRSYLNIAGRLPSTEEAREFLESTDSDKRTALIETLSSGNGKNSRLFNYWADLLRLQTTAESSGLGWHVWLRESVDQNKPYDKMVHEMLSAEGHAADNPAAGYYLRDRGMLLDNVSNTVEVFLGHQIGCAQCHDHPFDTFTQMDYYQLAAFLGGTEYKFSDAQDKIREVMRSGKPALPSRAELARMSKKERKKSLKDRSSGKAREEARKIGQVFRYHNRNALNTNTSKELKLPADYKYEDGEPGEAIPTRTIFGEKFKNVPPEDRKQVFADWVTSRDNPFFTKVIANRMWDYVFGAGIVPEIDNWSNSPDPLYPETMALLESAMKATDYDIAQFLRILYHTRLFQREVAAEEPEMGQPFHFRGPVLRRLSAEELRDSFITLNAGNVDDNRNYGLAEAWNKYAGAYQVLMDATPQQIKQVANAGAEAEKARRAAQAEAAKLRTEMREAKEAGNFAQVRKLSQKAREVQQKMRKKAYLGSEGSDFLSKVAPAVSRRSPRPKQSHKVFEMRSSELPSPARGNTLSREFGASDRETPSAGHTKATVPQSLRLLNGLETSLLTSKKTQFAKNFSRLGTPEERLDYLFLSLYSAKPTPQEKAAFLPEMKTSESSAVLARAILTSNRFLFVQ